MEGFLKTLSHSLNDELLTTLIAEVKLSINSRQLETFVETVETISGEISGDNQCGDNQWLENWNTTFTKQSPHSEKECCRHASARWIQQTRYLFKKEMETCAIYCSGTLEQMKKGISPESTSKTKTEKEDT